MPLSRPRPRFTVRRLMVVVAVVAFTLGGWGAWERYRAMVALSERYSQMARTYSETARLASAEASAWESIPAEKRKLPDRYPFYTPGDAAYHARKSREKARRYRGLASAYDRAALQPWLPVEPAPPEPE